MEGTNGGALSSRDRFDRLEQSVTRLNELLMERLTREESRHINAINNEHFGQVGERLRILESGSAPVSTIMREEFVDVRSNVQELIARGSTQAQLALTREAALGLEVSKLHDDFERRRGAAQAESLRYRTYMIILVGLQASTMVVSLLVGTHVIT